MIAPPAASRYVLRHPLAFAWRVVMDFRANQGLVLAGAIAYYTLLSIIPLFTLAVIGMSHLYGDEAWLGVLRGLLELAVPGLTDSLLKQLQEFLAHRQVIGWVGAAVMLFFSSIAFTVLENALSVIFYHRVSVKRRHYLVSAVMPYVFVAVLGTGLLLITFVAGALQAMSVNVVHFLGWDVSLAGVAGGLLYLLGVTGLVLLLTAIYMVLPNGGLSLRHALIGGIAAALLWEIARHVLIWYFATLSIVNVAYGSLATAIVALLSLEVAGMILLLGAQVIATYERLGHRPIRDADRVFHTDAS